MTTNGFQIGPNQTSGRKPSQRAVNTGQETVRKPRGDRSPPLQTPAHLGGYTPDPSLAITNGYAIGPSKVPGVPNATRTEPDPKPRGDGTVLKDQIR